jgi:hypothetical protein
MRVSTFASIAGEGIRNSHVGDQSNKESNAENVLHSMVKSQRCQ